MRRGSLLLGLWMTLAASAIATTTTRSARADDAAVAEAQERFKEGLDLADAGKTEAARLKFQQAWAVFKSPSVLYNLARAEQLTGHDLDALEHFRLFLRLSETDVKITDAMRDRARQNVAELGARVAQIEVDVPKGARVTIDGKALADPGAAPRDPAPVTPGRHLVEASYEGKTRSVTVDAVSGETTRARIDFDPDTAPPPPAPPSPSTARWLVPAAIGVAGLAGIGVGVGFALSSQSAKDDVEAMRRDNRGLCSAPESAACAAYDERRSDGESAATISYVGYIAGGALLAGAVATYLLWPSEKTTSTAKSGVSVTPWAAPGTGDAWSAGVTGRF